MKLEDIEIGQQLASREFPTEIGTVERIDWDDQIVYLRVPTSRGTDLMDLDPADLVLP